MRYQLLTETTHCVLVHEREEAQKAGESAQLHRVASMGLLGRSLETRLEQGGAVRYCMAAPARSMPRQPSLDGEEHLSVIDPAPETLRSLLEQASRHVAAGGSSRELRDRLLAKQLHDEVQAALRIVCRSGLDLEQALCALLRWIAARPGAAAGVGLQAWLVQALAGAEPAALAAATAEFEQLLGGFPLDGWESPRARRLRQALGDLS